MMFVERDIEGFKVFVPDYVSTFRALNSTGIVFTTEDGTEHIEQLFNIAGKVIQKLNDKLKKNKIKYIVIMTLAQFYEINTTAPYIALNSHVIVFYKRKPKYIRTN